MESHHTRMDNRAEKMPSGCKNIYWMTLYLCLSADSQVDHPEIISKI